MKIGIMTAAFPGLNLDQVLEFLGQNEFGSAEIAWQELIKALYNVGYNYVLNIEHEDPNFEGSFDKVKEGFLIAKRVLEPYTA